MPRLAWRTGMRRILAHLSSKGQMTLPRQARRALGVGPGDSIMVEIDDDNRVTISKPKFTIADLRGILPALDPPPSADFEQEIEEAMAERADRVRGIASLR
jgi:AbrB family looped-hinge helix DNA binding protein